GLSAQQVAQGIADGALSLTRPDNSHAAREVASAEARRMCDHIARQRAVRAERIDATAQARSPWLYLIVATGNIHEDIVQARAAA
ncbi:MAG TPA: lysine 5,6-aminomutase subunit alpha, partial [Rubrivivax sp.]|nr:lysine 5,6-aminomutase subunit alpha [Rubrivivax sp.]